MTDQDYKIEETKMTDPDYKIQEIFDPEQMRVYFRVHGGGPTTSLIGPRFGTLEHAKQCVRMCRKYENRVWHYVED